ncbi:MAG TPA: barstar family protein [Candidatus Acidoferrales bacterium]|nr:barstar family protein [Candidatus Acidoferrales bacterium]
MNNEAKNDFWRMHLAGVENPLIHFLPPNCVDLDGLRAASSKLGFAFFLIDAGHTQSVSPLLDRFAEAMNFPSYFGLNWDALLDLLQDLSWDSAKGYVLTLSNADPLLRLENNGFSVLLRVLESAIRSWRDGRGEYGERTDAVPFHVIFSGSDAVREQLFGQMLEPFCDHRSESEVRIERIPGGIGQKDYFHDAQRLVQGGADLEQVLVFLRDRRYFHIDSIYAIAALMGKPIPEAKTMVDQSHLWSTILREEEMKGREVARKALRDLGYF